MWPCPRCMGAIEFKRTGDVACMNCGWSGYTRRPTAEDNRTRRQSKHTPARNRLFILDTLRP